MSNLPGTRAVILEKQAASNLIQRLEPPRHTRTPKLARPLTIRLENSVAATERPLPQQDIGNTRRSSSERSEVRRRSWPEPDADRRATSEHDSRPDVPGRRNSFSTKPPSRSDVCDALKICGRMRSASLPLSLGPSPPSAPCLPLPRTLRSASLEGVALAGKGFPDILPHLSASSNHRRFCAAAASPLRQR